MNVIDSSNKLDGYDSNINNLISEQDNPIQNKNKENIINNTYANTKYNYERRKKESSIDRCI